MFKLKEELEQGTIDPHLSLLFILPYYPHVLKTCKASFSGWYLQLGNEWECLAIFHTLQNKADPEVQKIFTQ